jgi:hypothetical protein
MVSFTPGEEAPGTHLTGGREGPRAGLDAVVQRRIPSPCRESNLRTTIVQSVAYSLVSLRPQPPYPRGKCPQNPLGRKLRWTPQLV